MKKWERLANVVQIVLGALAGGSLFYLAANADISWWLVGLVFAWVISVAVHWGVYEVRAGDDSNAFWAKRLEEQRKHYAENYEIKRVRP